MLIKLLITDSSITGKLFGFCQLSISPKVAVARRRPLFKAAMVCVIILTLTPGCRIYKIGRDGKKHTTWTYRHNKKIHPGGIKTGHGIVPVNF